MSIVNLADAKKFLRVDYATDDGIIHVLLDGAENWVERVCGVGFTSASRSERLDGGGQYLWPSYRPVTAITAVTDKIAESVVDADNYEIISEARIMHKYDRWAHGNNRFEVVYTGGFGTVPDQLQAAVLQLVMRAYENRGGKSDEESAAWGVTWQNFEDQDVKFMLAPFRGQRC